MIPNFGYWGRWRLGELFAVLSGKGGTGKTSVCAGIASALAVQGFRVLCVDCDVGLRNLDISLGISDSGALSFLDVVQGHYPLTRATKHPVYPTLSFLTAPMNCPVEKIDPKAFSDVLRAARKEFDYIFLDAPAGVDAGFRLVSKAADRFLLVTGAGPAAVRDAARVGDLLELEQTALWGIGDSQKNDGKTEDGGFGCFSPLLGGAFCCPAGHGFQLPTVG